MTLDILHFIDGKGGNAEEIRESQRKRGLSVELVDEVIQMYADWVKSESAYQIQHPSDLLLCSGFRGQYFEQTGECCSETDSCEEEGAFNVNHSLQPFLILPIQAKENADELVAQKKQIDAQVIAKRNEAKDFEQKMRQRASMVGNLVGKSVPVSMTEVNNT